MQKCWRKHVRPHKTYDWVSLELVKDGVNPAIVLQSHAADAAYLNSRGITELVEFEGGYNSD